MFIIIDNIHHLDKIGNVVFAATLHEGNEFNVCYDRVWYFENAVELHVSQDCTFMTTNRIRQNVVGTSCSAPMCFEQLRQVERNLCHTVIFNH